MSGPLKDIFNEPFIIEDYLLNFASYPVISFVGDTYAGKNQIIRTLVNTLGGVYQEDKSLGERGRTREDKSYLFLEFGNTRELALLTLKSVAGDLMRDNPRTYNFRPMDNGGLLVVLKNLKSETIQNQLGVVETFLRRQNKRLEDLSAVITRANNSGDVPKRRLVQLERANFSKVYFVDNPTRRDYTLAKFPEVNAQIIIESLGEQFRDGRIIYFGKEQIPPRLGRYLAQWNNQFETKERLGNTEENLTPEERLFNAIFKDGTNIKV
jgi:hypothetical protein